MPNMVTYFSSPKDPTKKVVGNGGTSSHTPIKSKRKVFQWVDAGKTTKQTRGRTQIIDKISCTLFWNG